MYNTWTGTQGGNAGGLGGTGQRKDKQKNWENCNSIINKIYF